MIYRMLMTVCIFIYSSFAHASDTLTISFLYGSKPKKEFKNSQNSWFGGIHGGHVGISTNKNQVYHFLPDKGFHIRKHYHIRYSKFVVSNSSEFKYVLGRDTDSVKMLHIKIPIGLSQKKTIDSLHQAYVDSVPYDYAFIGMRCASASYEILSHIGLTKKKKLGKVVSQNFYPKKLRRKLIKKAKKQKWVLSYEPGSHYRIWEKD